MPQRLSTAATAPRPAVYQLGEIGISLTSETSALANEFAALYDNQTHSAESGQPVIAMEVRRSGGPKWAGHRYSVMAEGAPVGRLRNRHELLPALEWAINARVIADRRDFLQIHAASMVDPLGRGVLVVGRSGCGKSTLAAALLRRGWKYLCDEFAIIDPVTLRLHPFPKALCIKASGLDAVSRVGIVLAGRSYHVKGLKGSVTYLSPFDLAPDPIGEPSPVRFVIFPQYGGGAPPRLAVMRPGAAMFGMIAGVLNRDAYGARAASILHRVASAAESYSLVSGDLRETCDLLASLAERE